jgi:hypothetical protein
MIKYIISRVTMVKTGESFFDKIASEVIYTWVDYYNDRYLANNKLSYRVRLIE